MMPPGHLIAEGNETQMRLVLVGPPGAGKGTQAEHLAERLDVPHISTGDLFRSNLRDRTPLGVEAKRFIDAGDLVPDKVTVDMVSERLNEPDTADGFILDGFPRTVSQAESLAGLLQNNDSELDAVVELTLPDDTVVKRLLGRGRSDDTEEVIRRRQQVYRHDTTPLLGFYRSRLVSVDAVGAVEEITDRLFRILQGTAG
jgi:adenylate kinase